MSDKLNNEKDGKAVTDGNQVKKEKTNKHITIREATEEDYRKLQYWNVGTFYRVIQSDGKENMPGFKIGPKGRGKTKSSTPEASAEEEAPQQKQQPPVSQGSSQKLKSGSGKVKRSRD